MIPPFLWFTDRGMFYIPSMNLRGQAMDVFIANTLSLFWDRPHIIREICKAHNAQVWFW